MPWRYAFKPETVTVLPAEGSPLLIEENLNDAGDLPPDDVGRDDGELAQVDPIDQLAMDPRFELRVLRLGTAW